MWEVCTDVYRGLDSELMVVKEPEAKAGYPGSWKIAFYLGNLGALVTFPWLMWLSSGSWGRMWARVRNQQSTVMFYVSWAFGSKAWQVGPSGASAGSSLGLRLYLSLRWKTIFTWEMRQESLPNFWERMQLFLSSASQVRLVAMAQDMEEEKRGKGGGDSLFLLLQSLGRERQERLDLGTRHADSTHWASSQWHVFALD